MNASIAGVTAAIPVMRYAAVKENLLPRVSKSYLLTTILDRKPKNFCGQNERSYSYKHLT